jgi:adenylate cyclase
VPGSRSGADRAQRILDFLAEARRRKVYVSVVAYIAISIGVVELGGAITDALELPPATMQVLTILLMLGFPVVIVLAWIFDITTQGVVRTEPKSAKPAKAARSRAGGDAAAAAAVAALPQVSKPTVRARESSGDEVAEADIVLDPQRVQRAALGHMRHELRTPVNAIIGYSEMLLEDAADAAIESDLKQIRAGGRDLLSQIDRIISPDRWIDGGGAVDPVAFAAKAHAELRTPVTTILGYAELLVETCHERGRGELVPDLDRIVAAARRVLESTAGIIQAGSGMAAESLDAAATAMTRDVLVRIRPVEPGVLSVEGEGRILVVDDNAMNRDLLLRQLARNGYIVDTAEDGVQALERLAERAYDLILLDVLMPRMDGVQTLGRIRADERLADVPVLMLSSLDEVDSAIRCIELGAEEYLTKPFQPTLLAARIAANVALRRLRVRDRAWSEHVANMTATAARLSSAAFPPDVAARVLRGDARILDSTASATAVAFMLPRQARPQAAAELVERLDELAEAVAAAALEHDVESVVMRPYGAVLAVGFPAGEPDHAGTATALVVDLLQRLPHCGAGIHTGALAGGVIGSARPCYGLWGEAPDTAEALALAAPAGAAVLSPTTQSLVRERHVLVAGAVAEVAGHGHMRTWLLRPEPLPVTS